MQRLLISFELLEPTWTELTRKALYAELESLGAVQIQKSVWVTSTGISVAYASTKLRVYFGKNDRLLVALLGDDIRSDEGLHAI